MNPMQKRAAARPWFPEEDISEILRAAGEILRSGWLILGKYTHEFEESFQKYVGARHAVAVSSCTAALQIVLRFFDVHEREVILPANNFPGVVSAVLYEGGVPVLAETGSDTFCLDVADALDRIAPRTAGFIVVHMAGLICPGIDRLRKHCEENGLFLIEDASHAHGAAIGGRKAGSLADAACFSFYPTKIITTSTGGMITTDNSALADFARSVRHHGQGRGRGEFIRMGNDWCMSEIHALLGLHQLRRVDENVDHRNQLVQGYRKCLQNEDWLTIPAYPADVRHAYYKLPVLLREDIDADGFRRMVEEEYGIENGTMYDPPCHLQPVFRGVFSGSRGRFPKAESSLRRQFCPPVHSALPVDEVERVSEILKGAARRVRG